MSNQAGKKPHFASLDHRDVERKRREKLDESRMGVSREERQRRLEAFIEARTRAALNK